MSSPHAANQGSTLSKRTNNACKACRDRKVKCSGSHPCATCVRRREKCIFGTAERKVVISESYLDELRRSANAGDGSVSTGPATKRRRCQSYGSQESPTARRRPSSGHSSADQDDAPSTTPTEHISEPLSGTTRLSDPSGTGVVDMDPVILQRTSSTQSSTGIDMCNPLASGPSRIIADVNGRRRFLGPSSTWAYSRQVMKLIKDHLQTHESPQVPLNPDGRAFPMQWPSMEPVGPLAMDRMPSLDYALYLTNTVKFHLGQMYHLFHEKTFMEKLYQFYAEDGPKSEPLPGSRLWYIHFLLIMAFGQALLSASVGRGAASSELVSRAIELLPDSFGLYQDVILSIELLCCLALYLQSIDHRNSAFQYIGQAMRLALTQGLHRELIGTDLTDEDVQRHRAVWWTIYILDRRFSSLMGAPNSICDKDITVPLPDFKHNNQIAKSLALHVALSRLLAKVLNTVYGNDDDLGRCFLKKTQEVLRNLADLAPDLNASFEFRFDQSGPTSRVSATLNLYYHQCVVLATRPLLISLLRDFLKHLETGAERRRVVSEPVKALLKTSQDSAVKSLRILLAVQSQHLLETFLPFDLESTFSCAFILSLMAVIPSCPAQGTADIDTSIFLLNQMVARGNVIAEFRRDELEKLFDFLQLLTTEAATATVTAERPATTSAQQQPEGCLAEEQLLSDVNVEAAVPPAHQFVFPEMTYGLENMQMPLGLETIDTTNGLSPDQMLSVAELLDWDSALTGADVSWLWANPPEMGAVPGDGAYPTSFPG